MGGLRTSAETQTTARGGRRAGPAAAARPDGRPGRPDGPRRLAAIAAYLLAGVILFLVYLRLSQTYQMNSDSANTLLMAWDLLHGHLLLHGWYMSDVSFYPTELPQYALLESFLGPHFQTAHVAAAMTYTLVFLLAVVLARSGTLTSGGPFTRAGLTWTRTLIAAGIMLAPQFGLGVFALDLSVGHVGTAVPLLLTWLLLDKMPSRWYVPVLTAVLLAWALVADPIVYVIGVGPLGAVAAARVIRDVAKGDGDRMQRIAAAWFDLSLGAASVAAVVIAWVVNNVLSDMGGYVVNRLPFYLTPWQDLHNNWQAVYKVLEVYGANYRDAPGGVWLALALLHLASVLVVAWALARVARRFFDVSLVDQVLATAIVLNVLLFLFTNASDEAAHEVAVIAPFGAALAARVLVRPGAAAATGRARGLRLAAWAAGLVVLAGYAAGLGYEVAQPPVPPANTVLASWLLAHDLHYGLSGYWSSSSVTVDSDGRVQVRALVKATLQRDLWMSNAGWYNPKLHDANFIVLDSGPGFFNHWEPRALVKKYFGTPVRTYHTGRYTILVYDKNLLTEIPR